MLFGCPEVNNMFTLIRNCVTSLQKFCTTRLGQPCTGLISTSTRPMFMHCHWWPRPPVLPRPHSAVPSACTALGRWSGRWLCWSSSTLLCFRALLLQICSLKPILPRRIMGKVSRSLLVGTSRSTRSHFSTSFSSIDTILLLGKKLVMSPNSLEKHIRNLFFT